MSEETQGCTYDPQQNFPVPFTVISHIKKLLVSKPLHQPFMYQVYCPISCKKIKIGCMKEKKLQGIQFNTTSSRTVSVYVNQNVRYLINKHPPTKKDKKKVDSKDWGISIEVQDKGNIAIFNPYCVNPFDPLSFYTLGKIGKCTKPAQYPFMNIKIPDVEIIKLQNQRVIYLSKDKKLISHNPFFQDDIQDKITVLSPQNNQIGIQMHPIKIKKLVNSHLDYWFWQLQKTIDAQEGKQHQEIQCNLDQIYYHIQFSLNLDEQIRFKLMNKHSKDCFNQLYTYHPRLYSALSRYTSFFNYGNTRFDTLKLSEAGFFNKSDMLQDLSYFQYTDIPIPTAQQHDLTENQLRDKLFPFSRITRKLPFPNVPIQTFIRSLHYQTISKNDIILMRNEQNYMLFCDSDGNISAWSIEFLNIKLFSFNYKKVYQQQNQAINLDDKIQDHIGNTVNENEGLQLIGDLFEQFPMQAQEKIKEVKEAQIVPQITKLTQLMNMGYTPSLAKKALIQVKNQSIPAAIDAIQQIQNEQIKKMKKKAPTAKKQWSCAVCTLVNGPQYDSCQACGQVPEFIDEQQIQRKKQIQKQLQEEQKAKKQEQEKKKKQEQEKIQTQKKQKQEKLKKIKEQEAFLAQAKIIDIKLLILKSSPLNPFFIIVLLRNQAKRKTILRVFRAGVNRKHFLKFYRIEDNKMINNFNGNVYDKNKLQSFNNMAKSIRQHMQWKIKLFEAPSQNDWNIFETQSIQLEDSFKQIQTSNGSFKLVHQQGKNYYRNIQAKDSLESTKFQLVEIEGFDKSQQVQQNKRQNLMVEKRQQIWFNKQFKPDQQIIIPEGISQITVEVQQNIKKQQFKVFQNFQAPVIPQLIQNEVIMSQFIPLAIENYHGSVFSWKYYSTSILQKNNVYISNYQNADFTFKSLSGKPMLIQTITAISTNKRLQKIFPVLSGLVFTADQLSWFHIAKERFANMTKQDYHKWLQNKKNSNVHRNFWEPVGFFELQSQTQAQLEYKRVAKYIFLLPTSIKKQGDKNEVLSMKIDFFGVKGKILDQNIQKTSSSIQKFKNDGQTNCKFTVLEKDGDKWNEICTKKVLINKVSSANTFNFLQKQIKILKQLPLSVTTVAEIKFKQLQGQKKIYVKSKEASKISVCYANISSENIKPQQISSFKQLVEVQKQLTIINIQQIVQKLNLQELINQILAEDSSFSSYQSLLKILIDLPDISIKLFSIMSKNICELCNEDIQVSQSGLKIFIRTYQKLCNLNYKQTCDAIAEGWRRTTLYVNEKRNKNYNILRNKYKIEELVLEPYLFSKEYYRLIHPNYTEEQKVTIIGEPKSPKNNHLYVHYQDKWSYQAYIDLLGTKNVSSIDLYFPKINSPTNRCKLMIKIFAVNSFGEKQVYYRYFHEQFLVQMGIYAYKDNHIFQKVPTNCLNIECKQKEVRYLRMEVKFLLLTTMVNHRYKQLNQDMTILPIVNSVQSQNKLSNQSLLKILATCKFPTETKHNLGKQKLPPSKFNLQNQKWYYEIHEFQNKANQNSKKHFTQVIDKITTNIMDKAIVQSSINSISILEYQFGKKGLDFAYTYLVNLIKFFKKLPQDFTIPVDLMFNLYDTFVVYESGPINKLILSILTDLYKRLTNQQKSNFIMNIVEKYLSNIQKFKSLRISQQYSIQKIIESLKNFDLPSGCLFQRLSSNRNIFIVSSLMSLLIYNIDKYEIENQQVYDLKTAKYRKRMQIDQMMKICFQTCVWVLDDVKKVTQQMLSQSLKLLLNFFKKNDQNKWIFPEQRLKKFMKDLKQGQLWKVVFLTLKRKNEDLNKMINQLFKVFIENITQNFQKSINSMLLQVIKKSPESLYLKINPNVSDDLWMNHLQTILEYLNLTNSTVFLDIDTALCLLDLPLTSSLWSLVLHIIPRQDKILEAIIKNFPPHLYSALGKEITVFCEPLAGIRKLQTIHVNWLYLVKKIRIEGKKIFELFIQQLKNTSYGGKDGLVMALPQQVKQLEITLEFLKLVLQSKLQTQYFTSQNLKLLFSWFYLNKSNQNGLSPATENLKSISSKMLQLFDRMTHIPQILPACIKEIVQIKKDSQMVQGMFQQKRVPSYSAMKFNQKICDSFKQLLNIFMVNDDLNEFFSFQIGGVDYILSKLGLEDKINAIHQQTSDQDYFLNEGIIQKLNNQSKPDDLNKDIKPANISADDLKQEQFANAIKVLENVNPHNITASIANPTALKDWTVYKKGNKTKLVFLPLTGPTHQQYPLQIQLSKVVQVRSIKIGFPAASYQFNDKLVVSPSAVTIEGGIDMNHYQPIGQMSPLADDGYLCNGVRIFVLNLLKIRKVGQISQSLKQLQYNKVKYLKIIVKRPVVAFVEGNYSNLNNRHYNNLGCSVCFLSVLGDQCQKLSPHLVDSCRQLSRQTALGVLNNVINENNPRTSKMIANDQQIVEKLMKYFNKIKDHMKNYPKIVPPILFALGAGNSQFGDWLINQFLEEGNGQAQAKLVNQIITSTPQKIYHRINIFQKNIMKKISIINKESQIQSGLLFTRDASFMQSFCKTLSECYDIGFQNGNVLECDKQNINDMINIYDKKYSSPQIKSLIKLFVSLLYIKEPLKLSQDLRTHTLNIVWNNCSQAKPYFYALMAALLVNRLSYSWIISDDRIKIKNLLTDIDKSIEAQNIKILKLQMFLLAQISHHDSEYLKKQNIHIKLYNNLKVLVYSDGQVFEYLTKVIQNIVLGDHDQQKIMAQHLIQDVTLLVKRKDSILQKFYVGLMGLEKEVMVGLKDYQMVTQQQRKQSNLPTRFLNRSQQKHLLDKINKKMKFSLNLETESKLCNSNHQSFLHCFNNPPFLFIIRLKKDNKLIYCGGYSSARSVRNQQDSYYWQQTVNYEKGSFLFYFIEGQIKIIQNQSGNMFGSIYGGQQQSQNMVVFFDNSDQVIRIGFDNNNFHFNLSPELNGFKFDGLQLWEVKVLQSSTTESNKTLSLSNKAKAPFNYYRHNSIYMFPGKIQVSKFLEILGLKNNQKQYGKIKWRGKILQNEIILQELESQSNDFVIDIQIIINQQPSGQVSTGYMPKMNIFDNFSALGGVNQVLKIGSQSIKQWKKPDVKKNFQHYMQQLKSFVNLPNFFTLFIKNQQSVTFLFEVAAGLPDDPNTTRNWQAQQVVSSRFIYKIISDIFKFDRSAKLRDMDQYSDFCQIILQKLAQISKEIVRQLKQQEQGKEQSQDKVEIPTNVVKKQSQQKKKKKKGTGYGADNQNNSKWSPAQWLQNRKMVSQQILRVVSIFVSFLDCQKPLIDQRLPEIIKQSCLLPLLQSALRSGSMLDISKQYQLYKSYLAIIRNMANNPATIHCILDIEKQYKPQQTQSIHTLLHKLNGIAQIFAECLKTSKGQVETNDTAEQICVQIQKTYVFVDKAVKNLKKGTKGLTMKQINELPTQKAYRVLLRDLRFGYVDLKQNETFQHYYNSSISGNAPNQAKILRLSQQLADLSSSLPCQHTNSIFVRCDRSRIDVVKILVMGSKDTPYSNGAFMFDLYCDDTYPNSPPKMVITTTGQGRIRFNPNLYSCGKVCLSLLGTWRGNASQNWDPKLSTLLQLFISTQGVIMSQDVYFNQPGFEGQQGQQQGQRKNQGYSNIVRLGNIKFAMIQQIKNPPKGFEEVVTRHFYVKKKQILEEVNKWVEYADKRQASYNGLVNDHNSSWASDLKSSKGKYKQLLVKDIAQLKTLLDGLPQPNLKEKQQDLKFESKKVRKNQKAKQAKFGQIDVSYDPKQNQSMQQIKEDVMQDRWSRYIGAMGVEAVKKQSQAKVLLIGLKPLGLQIAKNLVLSGLKKLTIVDNDVIIGHEEHFYMSNMKGKKISQCVFKIKELNPYMLVQSLAQIPDVKGYNYVISTQTIQQSLPISQKCRQHSIGFINTQSCGTSGFYFSDFGKQFMINDTNGQQPFQGLIKNISCQQQGVVTLLEGVKHTYTDGDFIFFNKVKGMQEKQKIMQEKTQQQVFFEKTTQNKPQGINGRVFKIKVINWNSFSIGDTRNYTDYQGNGLCQNIKIPLKVQFKSFEQSLTNFDKYLDSNFGIYDFEKMGDNYSILVSYQALGQFKNKNKRFPHNWNEEDAKQFDQIVKKIATDGKKDEKQIQQICKFARKFCLVSQAQLPSIGAYLGGIVSQQVIKGITNKFSPIKQFFTFHLNELLPSIPQNAEGIKAKQINKEQPFRNIKIVVGKENAKKIEEMNTFIIGAGAIGCQLLKNFAMINMSSSGKITVTDPDHIETSNLTRQFLFRQKHVKKPKSATAAATLIQMNPLLNGHISANLDKICQATEDTYSDEFYNKQTIVANALDNVRARQYVDKRCVLNKKPLFESGTLGPKGHVQVIIPVKTQNYGSQNDPNQDAQIPHCTLKMFPQQTVHCIQWSRDIFGKKFTLDPKALKKVIQTNNPNSIEGAQKATVKKMIDRRPKNFEDCVTVAVHSFFKYFRNNVRQLLHTYPLNMKTKEGKPFWQLPKRPPKQITEIDIKDETHATYIVSYAVLVAKIYSISFPKDFRNPEGRQNIMKLVKDVKVPDFIPSQEKSKQLQQMQEKEELAKVEKAKNEQNIMVQKQEQPPKKEQEQITQQIKLNQQILQLKIQPQQFEKDEDSNGHIDLIYSMSNLRSRNYDLKECQWIEAKLKAGKITPALSTTTSVVAALQTLEIMKYIVGDQHWRNAFVNLAVPMIQISQPGAPVKHKIGNTQFTVWDEWKFKANSLEDLIKQMKDKYDVEAYNISTSDGKPIYWQAMYKDKQQAKNALMSKPLKNIFSDEVIDMNISLRDPKNQENYQNVPRIQVIIV